MNNTTEPVDAGTEIVTWELELRKGDLTETLIQKSGVKSAQTLLRMLWGAVRSRDFMTIVEANPELYEEFVGMSIVLTGGNIQELANIFGRDPPEIESVDLPEYDGLPVTFPLATGAVLCLTKTRETTTVLPQWLHEHVGAFDEPVDTINYGPGSEKFKQLKQDNVLCFEFRDSSGSGRFYVNEEVV